MRFEGQDQPFSTIPNWEVAMPWADPNLAFQRAKCGFTVLIRILPGVLTSVSVLDVLSRLRAIYPPTLSMLME